MRYTNIQVVLQEVPTEITLALSIHGCDVGCKGCFWDENDTSHLLTEDVYTSLLKAHDGLISCICFMGGEWLPEVLVKYLTQAKDAGFKTCLYTGRERVSDAIHEQLDYIKTGMWIEERGGLSSENTNQQMLNISSGENMNHHFRKHKA